MSDSVTMDLTQFIPVISQFQAAISPSGFMSTVLAPRVVRNIQAYMVSMIDKALSENGDIAEGESRVVRGQLWKGWAQKAVTKYGEVTVDGTRFYYRKFSRGAKGTLKGKDRKVWNAAPVSQRPFELVWKKRGRSKYDSSSKLMENTGALRQAVGNMQTEATSTALILRPGSGVAYFDFQNLMRPLWVFVQPDDNYVFVGYVLDELERRFGGGDA